MRIVEYKVDNFVGYTISNGETEDGSIAWPPIRVLSFAGVADEQIETSEGLVSPVVALAGKTNYVLLSLCVDDVGVEFKFAHRTSGEEFFFYTCDIENMKIDLEVKRINDNESDRYRIDAAAELNYIDAETGRKNYDYEPRVIEWNGVDDRSLFHRFIAWISKRTVCDTSSIIRTIVIKKGNGYEFSRWATITEIRR